jgi:hypothetical protein
MYESEAEELKIVLVSGLLLGFHVYMKEGLLVLENGTLVISVLSP